MPAFNLSPAQRADLRAQAHALKPVVIIGADGLTDPVVAEAKLALHSHQLIKIRVFGDDREERVAIADALCERLSAALVQHIGKLLVLWRPSDDDTHTSPAAAKKSRATGPSVNAAVARRVAASPTGAARRAAAGTGTASAGTGRAARPVKSSPFAERAPRKTPVRVASAATTASPRERAKTRDEEGNRTGKGGAPRLVTVVKPTGNDRRRAKPTQVLVRGNERVTAGGNVKKAKKRVTSIKRMRQQD